MKPKKVMVNLKTAKKNYDTTTTTTNICKRKCIRLLSFVYILREGDDDEVNDDNNHDDYYDIKTKMIMMLYHNTPLCAIYTTLRYSTAHKNTQAITHLTSLTLQQQTETKRKFANNKNNTDANEKHCTFYS